MYCDIIMVCQSFYVNPATKKGVAIDDMDSTFPESIIKLNRSIDLIIRGDHDWDYSDENIFSKVRNVDDIFHIIIYRINFEKGTIYIGLQKSNEGMQFTGFYSLVDTDSSKINSEIIVEHIISEINTLKDDTEKMVNILIRFFGTVHISQYGFSNIFENIKTFN